MARWPDTVLNALAKYRYIRSKCLDETFRKTLSREYLIVECLMLVERKEFGDREDPNPISELIRLLPNNVAKKPTSKGTQNRDNTLESRPRQCKRSRRV